MNALAISIDDLKDAVEPTPQEMESAAIAARALSKATPNGSRLTLCDESGKRTIELPSAIFKTLLKVLMEIGNGNTVAVIPVHSELTTGQAADLLNMSRPHLVKLIDQGELKCRMVGTHRKLAARDVLAYKDRVKHARRSALSDMTALDEELGLYEDEA